MRPLCFVKRPKREAHIEMCCEYAQRGKGRRKLYQLHGRSLLRIGCHMTIDSLYLVDDRSFLQSLDYYTLRGQIRGERLGRLCHVT
jgi:hypothetical protein